MDYLLSAIERAVFEIVILFGGVFALATMLWFASQRLRGDGYSRFGRAYVYFVAPGVVSHETGHALGCLLTGTRIVEFVPFRLSGNELGHVTHECRKTFLGRIADFFIGTGPVWFGCLMIFLLARLLGGRCLLEGLESLSPPPGGSILGYCFSVLNGAAWMFKSVFSPSNWGSILFPLCFYLIFCIASEITLSPPDLQSTWRGFASLLALIFILNFIPVVSAWFCLLVDSMIPSLYVLHSLLVFVLLFDLILLLAVWLISRAYQTGRSRR